MSPPVLTIGLPVLNRGDTLSVALESILSQTRGDFRILIADNASTDSTAAVISDFVARDSRIEAVRRPVRVNGAQNFGMLVDSATTPYFMFAPADDQWHPEFIAETLGAIEADPEAALICPLIEFEAASGERTRPGGTYAISGSLTERLKTYLGSPGCNSRIYGIHRTVVLRAAFDGIEDFVGWDWLLMAKSLVAGPHREIGRVLMTREMSEGPAFNQMIKRYKLSRLNRVLPGLTLTRELLKLIPGTARWALMPTIAKMNLLMLQGSPCRLSRAVYWGFRKPVECIFGRPARIG